MVNPIDRIQRIGMTGDIEDPKRLSPVDNIMQHYPKAQENPQEEGGFWNGLKKFAGSKGGRMLIGGLGSGLAVGLTGGNIGDALGYGVIGAGKTAENLYKQEQDQKTWEEKEADRLARQQESEANRQHDWDIANARIEADRQARKDEMDRVLKTLELKDQYGAFDKKGKTPAEQLKALADAGATPESLNMFAEANGLTGYKFERPQKLSGNTQFLDYMVNTLGIEPNIALQSMGKLTPEQQLAIYQGKATIDTNGNLVEINAKHQNAKELQSLKAEETEAQKQRDFDRSLVKSEFDNELKKGFEAYKKTLPVDKVVELEQKAALMNQGGFNVTAGDLAMEDYLNDVASRSKTNALTDNINARTGIVGKTPQMLNAEWLANNPNATMEQKIAMGISGAYGKAYNDAIMTGKTPEEANKIAMAKVQQDIITGQIMSGMFGGMPSGQPPIYPQESTEDVEYVTF